jgi:hypothetical protein
MSELQERTALEPVSQKQVAPAGLSAACACHASPVSDVDGDEDFADEEAGDAQELRDVSTSGARPRERFARRPRARCAPSSCGCQAQGQPVYVVGELSYDFGLLVRQRSMQDNFDGAVLNGLNLADPAHFLMYLLGYTGIGENGPRTFGGHLYDASSVHWLVTQDGCPKYAVRPGGAFAEAAYLELVRFFSNRRASSPVSLRRNGAT